MMRSGAGLRLTFPRGVHIVSRRDKQSGGLFEMWAGGAQRTHLSTLGTLARWSLGTWHAVSRPAPCVEN